MWRAGSYWNNERQPKKYSITVSEGKKRQQLAHNWQCYFRRILCMSTSHLLLLKMENKTIDKQKNSLLLSVCAANLSICRHRHKFIPNCILTLSTFLRTLNSNLFFLALSLNHFRFYFPHFNAHCNRPEKKNCRFKLLSFYLNLMNFRSRLAEKLTRKKSRLSIGNA